MPVLLAKESAPNLFELLEKLSKKQGLSWHLPKSICIEQLKEVVIQGIGSLVNAGRSEISFLANPKLFKQLQHTQAGAVFIKPKDYEKLSLNAKQIPFLPVLCNQPYFAYATIAQWFEQQRLKRQPKGIHPQAVIHPTATIGEGVYIGPLAVVEAHCHIANGVRIEAGCYIGPECAIGQGSILYPRVSLYHQTQLGARCIVHSGAVIGADGFGFAPHPVEKGHWAKIAQLGAVHIGNDVEIGANTTIDRGALDNTIIYDGVKLDNQIMVAHNVIIGAHTAIAACVGIAGSTKIGARCIIGGAAMISGHLNIADDVQISGGTAITSSVHNASRLTGVYPYQEHKQWQRNAAVISQLSNLRKRLRELERTLTEREK